jgi:hypothetical protein
MLDVGFDLLAARAAIVASQAAGHAFLPSRDDQALTPSIPRFPLLALQTIASRQQ